MVLLSSSWNHLGAQAGCGVWLCGGHVPGHKFIHCNGLLAAMVANTIRLLLQHGIGALRVVDRQHAVPMDVGRAIDWDAHHTQLA